MISKIDVVFEILDQLHVPEEKEILVFNKIDVAPSLRRDKIIELAQSRPYVFISTKTKEGIDELIQDVLPKFLT